MILVVLASGVLLSAGASAAAPCDKVAAPAGLDSAPGSEAQPVRSAQKLADLLLPGEAGCLRAGDYEGGLVVTNGGTQGNPVTLESYPGERARISGVVSVEPGADFVTISGLDLVGLNPYDRGSPLIQADHVRLEGNEITNDRTGDCVFVGTGGLQVTAAVIENNRIHDCGRLPATNRNHGINVWNATGTQITNNVIYDNADRGIQLFPDAQQTSVVHNTIDGNGEGILIAGTGVRSSNDNVIERNVISNSTIRYNVETYWPDGAPVGTGNVLRDNCVFGAARADGNGGLPPYFDGLVASGNLVDDPAYADRAGKDFTLQPGPCRALVTEAGSTSIPTGDLTGWHLVLSDDFPGTSLDLTKWYEPYDSPSHHWRPQQVSVHDGVLDIDAAKQADGYWWSSGVNGGRGLMQTYGKYLVRARFDAGRGISDALMVFPTGTTGCDWPPSIDFSESGGDHALTRTSYSGFYHYRSPVTGCGSSNDGRVDFGSVSADFTQYHVIGVEWTPGKLVYTLDGQPWATSTDINIGQFNTIKGELVLQSQSCNESPCTDATTPLHVHLIVDWVAIYAYQPLG